MSDASSERDFERPIIEIEKRIEELESFSRKAGVDLSAEIEKLRARANQEKREIFARLNAWQRVLLSRDPNRPDLGDYLAMVFEDFVELHGDRAVGDDRAIVTGLAKVGGIKVLLVGQRKGKTTKERMAYNFGSPNPEGYRKAILKMKLAEKFRLPVVTLVNTPGAYPGIGAEERGQAFVIARNLYEMSRLRTPIISVVIGEGGSGGALGICVADKLAILENAYLSVISPEGCAAILWRDASKAPLAAQLLRLTPQELKQLGIVDEIVPEPLGGAHRNPKEMGDLLRAALVRYLDEALATPLDRLLERRYEKYRRIGAFLESEQQKLVAGGIPGSA
ncbi:MAG TPA: acetyl-CoA carboxylase carboxyltransferase subunit alpha [Planctomycetota bacterium]|jgi:acetyl-CoA carboxylase carboxyl transferase subunit alpha|nr:acetyl-CoA carboxylase carboxyltransferase subunit alpha [Planctomycetota bacterium]